MGECEGHDRGRAKCQGGAHPLLPPPPRTALRRPAATSPQSPPAPARLEAPEGPGKTGEEEQLIIIFFFFPHARGWVLCEKGWELVSGALARMGISGYST